MLFRSGEVSVWDGKEEVIYKDAKISQALVGMYGTAVFEKNDPSKLIGFLADTKNASFVKVKSTDSGYITTETGKIAVSKTVKVSNMGIVADYITSWFDIRPESNVMIIRDSKGNVNFISVLGTVSVKDSVIYSVDNFAPKTGAKFVHNGAYISQDKLKKYDVLTYSQENNTYYVSDNTLILKYTNSGPTFNNPTYIEAGGQKYNITDKASTYFQNIKIGQVISLLLDYNGNVAGAFAMSSNAVTPPTGLLTKLTEGEFEIKLNSGYVIKGTPDLSNHSTMMVDNTKVTTLYKSLGRLVTVRQNSDGKFSISPVRSEERRVGKEC